MGALTPPLKWHGGKHYLARKIVELMPSHLHYVEPFAGGLAVLLARDPSDERLWAADTSDKRGVSEVVNDIDGRLINFWRVLASEELFYQFSRRVQAVPLSRDGWREANRHIPTGDAVQDAVMFFVQCRQSRSGLRTTFTPWTRNRTRRGMNGNVSEWLNTVDGLPEVHRRLRRVGMENMPALELIRREDTPESLFYCDPPYLAETRQAKTAYAHEMTDEDHRELLDALRQVRGKVMLSGYPSALYDGVLSDWNRHTFTIPNNAAGGKVKRRMTEVLWCNY